jgi:hypothetical protein
MHFGGTTPNTIHVSHSNVRSVAYGVMFYAGTGANFTYDNWMNNTTNVDPTPGTVTGDFTMSYFQGAAPNVAGITVTTPALASANVACTGANDTVCAGPRP